MSREGQPIFRPEDVYKLLVDYTGQTVTYQVRKAIAKNVHFRRFCFIGGPGGGKTVTSIGARRTLLKEHPDVIGTAVPVLFDPIRREYLDIMQAKGYPAESLPELPKDKQDAFGDFLYLALYTATTVGDPTSRKVFFIEAVADGNVDRGQLALQKMAESNAQVYKETGKVENFVLDLIGDPKVIRRAKKIREKVAMCDNDYELIVNLREEGIDLRMPTEEDRYSTELLNKFLREATPKQIDMIDHEVNPKVEEAYDELMATRDKEIVKLLPKIFKKPKGVRIETEKEWEHIVKLYFYKTKRLLNMGFHPDAFTVAINQMLGDIAY